MHGALAEATDPEIAPERRAWHRAQAAAGPDEEVAAELERSAGRAQTRGGLAAAAAFLERSALLTADPARRAERSLAAAQAQMQAGAFDNALGLLAAAESGPLDEFASARADLLRGHVAFAASHGSDAPPLLPFPRRNRPPALGIEARCRALVSDGETAERLYQEAIDRLGRTQLRPDLARAHLLYGEWLQGRGRCGDAREQLRTAYGMLAAIGMEAFAERARRELIATGETVRKRTVETSDQLTA